MTISKPEPLGDFRCLKTGASECSHADCTDTYWDQCVKYATQVRDYVSGKNRIKTYFVTFTKRQDIDNASWVDALKKFVQRKSIITWVGCIEHINTNIHAHFRVEYDGYLYKRYFTSYIRKFGHIKIDLVFKDNGIEDYIMKAEEDEKLILRGIEDFSSLAPPAPQ